MKQGRSIALALAIGFQFVVIFSMVVFKMAVLIRGTNVMLKIEPVDPRDWLRGDHVIFQYDISNVPSHLVGQDVKMGDSVYVLLTEQDPYWQATRVQKQKPTEELLFIKGTVRSPGKKTTNIRYGIEQYFIPEGTGKGFSFRDKESAAEVAIDKYGNAVLKQIYVDGKKWP